MASTSGVELAGEAVVVAGAAAAAFVVINGCPAFAAWPLPLQVAAAGALTHLMMEATGANAWYVARKAAGCAAAAATLPQSSAAAAGEDEGGGGGAWLGWAPRPRQTTSFS